MALLALTGEALGLSFRAGQWVIDRRGEAIRTVRGFDVDEVQAYGPIEIRASARAAALARGIPLVFLTQDGRYRGRLDGPRSNQGAIPLAQARWLALEPNALAFARGVVAAKLHAQWSVLVGFRRRRPNPAIAAAACSIRLLAARAADARTVDQARGFEGGGAATYFGCFGGLLSNPAFSFRGRNRRPPRDPVNACLSFGYTLLLQRVVGLVQSMGLLPGLGALHQPIRGQPALALDLMEEFRPLVVDRMVLRLLNLRRLGPDDFTRVFSARPHLGADPPLLGVSLGASRPPPAGPIAPDPDGAAGPAESDPFTDAVPEDPLPLPPPEVPPPPASPDWGGDPRPAIYLSGSGRGLFLQEFQRVMREPVRGLSAADGTSLAGILERQARRAARVFLGTDPTWRPAAARPDTMEAE